MEIYNGTYCVYIHTNKINGKMYVGQTIHGDNPNRRWVNGEKYKGSPYFYSAIQKYGWDNFSHEIIASKLTKAEADNFEKILIRELKTQNKKYGYNICDGGNTSNTMNGRKLSETTKQKIRESKIGEKNPMYGVHLNGEKNPMYGRTGDKHPNYGKRLSEEHKEKISIANSGKRHSDETKDKMSKSRKGKKMSDEVKQKISQSNKGKIVGGDRCNAKHVVQFDDDGNFIKEWDCISTAWRTLGICRTSIPQCLSGKQKHAGGYCWELASKYYERKP